MRSRLTAVLAALLLLAQAVLVLVSWLLSATMASGVRSLLSSEGIRFLVGGYVDCLLQPLLVWILLLAMAWGCLCDSGLLSAFGSRRAFRHRPTAAVLMVVLLAYVGVVLLLSATSHAVLLSATGRLWPSPFSRALVPFAAFGAILLSVAYGLLSHRYLSLPDVCRSLTGGMAQAAPLLLVYMLAAHLCASVRFVF